MVEATSREVESLRIDLVDACRILAATGLVREITGHVSVRIPGSEDILVRCRRPNDPGVEHTTVDDIRRVGLDGHGNDLVDGYKVPGEFSIHAELYRARPDVCAVVHGHPRSALVCGIVGIPLEPIVGAYDPPVMELAARGVPVFPRAVLISTPVLGQQLADAMGNADACLLAGHGIVTTGRDIAEATERAIKLETLAEITLQCHATGLKARVLSDEEIAGVRDFVAGGEQLYTRWRWEFWRRLLPPVEETD